MQYQKLPKGSPIMLEKHFYPSSKHQKPQILIFCLVRNRISPTFSDEVETRKDYGANSKKELNILSIERLNALVFESTQSRLV